ncbi:MAG: DNA polymerase III subunit gamma/tau [Bacteriovoracaceae bacterium]|nr:DNA polymerase III subunit gamma/tau [Bacteriovoracaceae bacterium]
MAYQVLSRKWRPKKFQDVVGQEHVTRSFQNTILKDRLGHAYVLTGTRGIGKTSVARIFAKSLRCLNREEDANPCNRCEGCKEFETGSSMNVLEIDGASNNSVDDIRELVNNVQTLPTFGKYKVYIIDEVHMLTTNAFNALLKTLEEPPSHTVFLLATTEPHKLLDTVLSRCIRFDFRNASAETLSAHIKDVAEKEGIKFQDEKLIDILANQGNGSFRDTLSLMDQVLSFSDGEMITEEIMSIALGLAKISSIKNLCEHLILGDSNRCSEAFKTMLYENVSIENITHGVLDFLYELITEIDNLKVLNLTNETLKYIEASTIDEMFWIYESLSKDFSWALNSQVPEKTINIIFQKHARRSQILQGTGLSIGEQSEPKKKVVTTNELSVDEIVPAQESKTIIKEPLVENEPVVFKAEVVKNTEDLEEKQDRGLEKTWNNFEQFLKMEIPAIYAELEQGNALGELSLDSDMAIMKYGFSGEAKLFYEHLVTGEGKEKIESLMKIFFEVSGAQVNLAFLDDEKVEEEKFLSKSDIRENERQRSLVEKENRLRTHPVIQEAEKLFGKPIDRIKVKEE